MTPFSELPRTPAEHFKLHCYEAVLRLRELVPGVDDELPFLRGYYDELDETGLDAAAWSEAVADWERDAQRRLPIVALREAACLERQALVLLFVTGLPDEDPRFGDLFEGLNGAAGRRRPTEALLHGWLGIPAARPSLRRLREIGLLEPAEDDGAPHDHLLRVPAPLWSALRGDAPERPTAWARHRAADDAPQVADLILPRELRQAIEHVPEAIAASGARAVIARGPSRSGRRTVLSAIARELGGGTLFVAGDVQWPLVGPLATLLGSMPVLTLEITPGETSELPTIDGYDGPVGVALGTQGGLVGERAESAIVIELAIPEPEERDLHWRAALADHPQVPAFAARRMTGGNIRRAAALARSEAALDGRTLVSHDDVRAAVHTLQGRLLDTFASRVRGDADWTALAAPEDTLRELELLESRCRHREVLGSAVGETLATQLTPGVRALFTGPSGTGKTLAARVLASALGIDLYRIDLSLVVNKYIGETEKNLAAIFSRAEEADIALLLDEGDALLTQRTAVQSSNDRWANLETNYLLQRLESFEGILFVTTNAGERIDAAFRRRMDVVVEFRVPEPAERWQIWQLHLPEDNGLDDVLLNEVSVRCALTGGQIRNAVVHASLLSLDEMRPLDDEHLRIAIAREYRKAGQVCPLPRAGMVLNG
jgi:hypothetical protein